MKLLKLALLISSFAFFLFVIACSNPANLNQMANSNSTPTPAASPTATPDQFAQARLIYAQGCQICHGPRGEGGLVEREGQRPLRVPSYKEGHALTHTDAEYVRQITNGGDGMPAFGDKLTPEQINQLVNFIRAEFQAGLNTHHGAH